MFSSVIIACENNSLSVVCLLTFAVYNQMVVSGNADFYSMKIDYFPDKSFYFPNQKCITVAKLNELFSISSHLHKDERNYPSATLIMKTNKFWRLDEIEISF